MEYSEFVNLTRMELNRIYEYLDKSNFDGDFDIINDILHIYTHQGEYVINPHSPSKQIWLSSPISNAGYFSYDQTHNSWLEKNGTNLLSRVLKDLNLS